MTENELKSMTVVQLRKIARDAGVVLGAGIDKAGIIAKILEHGVSSAPAAAPAAPAPEPASSEPKFQAAWHNSDAPRYTSFIITPMSFLCNTFFSTEQMPAGFRQAVAILPLSQPSSMIRAIANGQLPDVIGFVILGAYLVVFGLISMVFIYRKKNL